MITPSDSNAQRLLEALPVEIPFADRLSFPSSWMRTRRDHARFLNLIEVSAFLHQHQRERTADGAIVAALADYETAYALASEVLRETLSDLKKPLREALQRIQGLAAKGDDSVTRRGSLPAVTSSSSSARVRTGNSFNPLGNVVSMGDGLAAGTGSETSARPPPAAPTSDRLVSNTTGLNPVPRSGSPSSGG